MDGVTTISSTTAAPSDSAMVAFAAAARGEGQQFWYAAYTRSRHEKSVARQLEERGMESFLPLYRSMRRWKDRRQEVDMVLFPGYVFVRFHWRERLQVLQLPSVLRLVTFNGLPAPLPVIELEAL